MFRKKMAILTLVLAGLMGVANSAQAAEQMDNGVWVDVYRVGNSRTGRMAVFFVAQDRGGKLAICGNYYMWGGGSVFRILQRALRRYRFFYDGQTLFSDASFLWRAPSEEQIGDELTCTITDLPYAENSNDLLQGRMPFAR